MKKFLVIMMLMTSVCLFAQDAKPELQAEEEKDWGISLGLTFARNYFDKGSYVNIDPIFQGDVEFTWKQLFVGATGFFDCTDQNDHRQSFEEYDFTAGWRPTLGGDWDFFIKGIDFQLAYIYYLYPRVREDDSNELNFAANLQCLLNPGVDIYWDFEDDLWYGNFNVSHDFTFMDDKLTWNIGSQLWWGNRRFQERDYEVSKNSAFSVVLETSLTYAITENISFGPFASCGWALGSQMRQAWKEPKHQSAFNATYGVALTVEF